MPVSGAVLANLIQTDVDNRMSMVRGTHPLEQKNPSYYIEFCQAIGLGLILHSHSIAFVTNDMGLSGLPLVPGVGVGTGIIVDPTFFIQDLYTRIRNYVIQDFGRTMHDPWPPRPGNSGEFLKAFCEGINDAFMSYYPTAWALASVHPIVYLGTGTINDGQFSGLSAPTIQQDIIQGAPNFVGRFWPRLAQAVAESYVLLIEQHSTGSVTITGVCIPSLSQVCSIVGVPGTGSGVAT